VPSEAPLTERGENLDLFPARQGNRLSVIEAADRAGALISGQVRSVIEAAELHARTICEEAERDARQIVADAGRDAQLIGERVDAVAGPLAKLLEDLRRQSDRLTIQMAAHDMLRGRPFEIVAAVVEEELDPDSVEDLPLPEADAAPTPDDTTDAEVEAADDEAVAAIAEELRTRADKVPAAVTEQEPDSTTRPCTACGTTGGCPRCHGKGRRFGFKCSQCGGAGTCLTCGGQGYLWAY
jgi:vacuolar-type H+-ATPase subunit H